MIDSSANELNVSRETYDQTFKRQEEIMKQMRDDLGGKKHVLIKTL